MIQFGFLTGLLLAIFLSASLRAHVIANKRKFDTIQETKNSPFSQALTELVTTAGGIYLALVMIISFLGIELPGKSILWGVSVEPLAFIALFLALIQPIFLKFFR